MRKRGVSIIIFLLFLLPRLAWDDTDTFASICT